MVVKRGMFDWLVVGTVNEPCVCYVECSRNLLTRQTQSEAEDIDSLPAKLTLGREDSFDDGQHKEVNPIHEERLQFCKLRLQSFVQIDAQRQSMRINTRLRHENHGGWGI